MEQESKKAKELSVPHAIILAGIIIAGAIFLSTKPIVKNTDTSPKPTKTASVTVSPLSETDHLQYSDFTDREDAIKNAELTIIEYSDLECPYCKRFHPTMKKIMGAYPGKVVWTYRHFPLDQIHTKARAEANAAECAAEQGGDVAFWKFIDQIFEISPTNDGLDPEKLPLIANDIGLNTTKFNECLAADRFASKVEADYQTGLAAGVQGTPATFIIAKDGRTEEVMGAESFDSVKAKIDKLLTK